MYIIRIINKRHPIIITVQTASPRPLSMDAGNSSPLVTNNSNNQQKQQKKSTSSWSNDCQWFFWPLWGGFLDETSRGCNWYNRSYEKDNSTNMRKIYLTTFTFRFNRTGNQSPQSKFYYQIEKSDYKSLDSFESTHYLPYEYCFRFKIVFCLFVWKILTYWPIPENVW